MNEGKQHNNEVDILELFKAIFISVKNFFYKLIRLLIVTIIFSVKNIHFLILFIIFGSLCGFLFYKATSRYFSSDLIAESNGIHAKDMVKNINDLSVFADHGNYKALAIALHIPDSIADDIKAIKAYTYIDLNKDGEADIVDFTDSFDASDTTQIMHEKRIYLQIELFNNKIINEVKKGLFDYINSNEYLIKLCELHKNDLEELVKNTELEIKKLDSLQDVEYFRSNSGLQMKTKENMLVLLEKEQQMYYKDKFELIKKKQNYIKEKEFSDSPLTIVKDFTPLTLEENPKSNYIINYSKWFLILGFISLVAYKNWGKILKWIN